MRKQKLDELRSYIEELKTIEVLEQNDQLEELRNFVEKLKKRDLIDKRQLMIICNKLERSFIKIQKLTCLLGNGEVILRESILKNNQGGSAAICLPITKEGNTLLVVQPRVLTKNTVGVELPAGYIENGEVPIMAAKRELVEETGYIPRDMHFLASYYQDQGCSGAFNYSYLALDCEKKEKQHLDNSEFIRYFECTYDEALELVDLGYINDANSMLALEKSYRLIRKKV